MSDPLERKAFYLGRLRDNHAAIMRAAALGFEPPIRGCPGWDVAGLTGHMGRVYTFWQRWITQRPEDASREAFHEIAAQRDEMLPGFTVWDRAGYPKDTRPSGDVVAFAEAAFVQLMAALEPLPPDEHVWTFVPSEQSGAFIFRRLCMETTIHRWDAEEAQGIQQPIDDGLARDGIDEILTMYFTDPEYGGRNEHRHGQTILLDETDGHHWLVTFAVDGFRTADRSGPADATVSGSASDLWLYVMGRKTAGELTVTGDTELPGQWSKLAGQF